MTKLLICYIVFLYTVIFGYIVPLQHTDIYAMIGHGVVGIAVFIVRTAKIKKEKEIDFKMKEQYKPTGIIDNVFMDEQ